MNNITEISGLDSQTDTLEELWINDNKIEGWDSIEYLGKTQKKLDNLYIANNPVYSRGNDFKEKIKAAIPCLKQLEGSPFDRKPYFFSQPAGVQSIVKKGINPKAKAILDDILGKTAADEYQKDHE